ncbi:MAG: hypothetical protein EXS31_02655 [Pedosphaera sp.]|nr:hypothetical protein [Pedosphaera sp.]
MIRKPFMKPLTKLTRIDLMNTTITRQRNVRTTLLGCLLACCALSLAVTSAHAQGRGGTGGTGAGAGGGRGSSNPVNTRVVAVADEHSNSVVIAAPDDILPSILEVIAKLDEPVADITEFRLFPLKNADPTETANVLATLFPDERRTGSNSSGNQQQLRLGGGAGGGGAGGGGGGRGNAATSPSERMKKQGIVLAVPEPRTSSVIVRAAKELMPEIASLITQLDASSAKKQKVFVYSLDNADPQQLLPILQEMFQTTTTSRSSANQNSALSQRIQAGTQQISTGQGNSTGFGGNSGGGGGGNFGGGQTLR